MPATKLSIETKADGSGVVVPAQTLRNADTLTVYSIGRTDAGVFDSNVAATAWSLQSVTDGIVAGDLVAAGDLKSAVFTAALDGSCVIHATSSLSTTPNADSGVISVIAYAIALLEEVKKYLGDTGTGNDTLLTDWIKKVSKEIESELNQAIVKVAFEEIHNGMGSSKLYMRNGRVISIFGTSESARLANVQYRNVVTEAWTNLLTDEDLIYINPQERWAIELLDGETFPLGTRNIRIKYNGGFATVPHDIVKMMLERMQVMWDESKQGSNLLGKVSRNIGEGGMSQNLSLKDMKGHWEDVIARYKRYGFD